MTKPVLQHGASQHGAFLDHDKARQGVTGHHVRHVLAISLALVLVMLFSSWAIGAG